MEAADALLLHLWRAGACQGPQQVQHLCLCHLHFLGCRAAADGTAAAQAQAQETVLCVGEPRAPCRPARQLADAQEEAGRAMADLVVARREAATREEVVQEVEKEQEQEQEPEKEQ